MSRSLEPGNIRDWASACAERVDDEYVYRGRRPAISRVAAIIATYAEPLITLLREAKREHYHCDDSWYCCRACRATDHQLEEGYHLGQGLDGPGKDGKCTCGADAWNARVDAALAAAGKTQNP